MGRQILPLTADRLPLLVEPCRSCLFWERTPAQSARRVSDPLDVKADWVRTAGDSWGTPGRIALVDRVPAGYVTYAPAHLVPRALAFPTAPVSEDAVILLTARIDERFTGQGLGRVLLQRAARDVLRHGIQAIEVFATTGAGSFPASGAGATRPVGRSAQAGPFDAPADGSVPRAADVEPDRRLSTVGSRRAFAAAGRAGAAGTTAEADEAASGDTEREDRPQPAGPHRAAGPSTPFPFPGPGPVDGRADPCLSGGHRPWEGPHHCLLPIAFLTAVGFYPVRNHPLYPRMRLDLRTALRWRKEWGLLVERLFTPARSLGGRRPVGTVN